MTVKTRIEKAEKEVRCIYPESTEEDEYYYLNIRLVDGSRLEGDPEGREEILRVSIKKRGL